MENAEGKEHSSVQKEEEWQALEDNSRSSSRSIEHAQSASTLRRRGTSSWGMDEAQSGWVRSQVNSYTFLVCIPHCHP